MAREYGMSPGRSQAQFGHAGHAGKSPVQAHRDQRQGRDTPQAQQHITGGAAPPAAVTRAPDFVRQQAHRIPTYRSMPPKQGFLQGIGNKFRDFTVKMRGWNEEENRPNTQDEYDANRQARINQKRIQNITSRDIPWREQTLQTLGDLGYQGDLSRSQIGTTPFDRYPPREGTPMEDYAKGIRATDAAQDMIYPKRKPIRQRTRTFPDEAWLGEDQETEVGNYPDPRWSTTAPSLEHFELSKLFNAEEGPFSPKSQVEDPDEYYRNVMKLGTKRSPYMGWDDSRGPLSKPEDEGEIFGKPYINYEMVDKPGGQRWEYGQDPRLAKETNPMLMDALINQKNRSGELVQTEYIPSYDTTDKKDYIDLSKSVSSEDIGDLTRTGTWQDQMGGQLMGDFEAATKPIGGSNVGSIYDYMDFLGGSAGNVMGPGGMIDPIRQDFNLEKWNVNSPYSMWLRNQNPLAQGGYIRSRYSNGGRVGILAAF